MARINAELLDACAHHACAKIAGHPRPPPEAHNAYNYSEIVRRMRAQMNAVRCLGAYASVAWDAERVMARAKGKAALLRLAPAVCVNVIDGKFHELPTRDLSSTKASDAWPCLHLLKLPSHLIRLPPSLPAPSRPEKAMGRRSVTCFLFAHCLVVAGCVPSWYCLSTASARPSTFCL